MTCCKFLLSLLIGVSLLTLSAVHGDEGSAEKSGAPKGSFVTAGQLVGQIVQIDKDGTLTLRVTWQQPKVQRSGGGRGRNRRPPRVTLEQQEKDLKIEVLPDARVRSRLPDHRPKPGERPAALGAADLQPGHIVQVVLVKSKAALKTNPDQLLLHTAVILAEGSTPAKRDEKK